MTPQQLAQLNEATLFIQKLKSSFSIPLEVDQAFTERFHLGNYTIFSAGSFFTLGGDNLETVPIDGISQSDFVYTVLRSVGATPRTIITSIPNVGGIDVTFSGDPSTDHSLFYIVLRP